MKICLDPGHGGKDPGAVGPTELEEAAVNLDLGWALVDMLEVRGLKSLLTRTEDIYVDLGRRCDIANEWEADYFVSIHCNSNGSDAVGIETLYVSDAGMAMAEPIQQALIAATRDVDRGLKFRSDLYVLNGTDMPAVLVEIGFISHPPTESKLKTSEYKNILVEAIANGLCEYLEWT